jgi:hypothetical protein
VKKIILLTVISVFLLSISFGFQHRDFETLKSKNFIINYEPGISQSEIKLVMGDLEIQHKIWYKRLGLVPTQAGTIEVRVYKNENRYFRESRSLLKEEGCYSNGMINLATPSLLDQKGNRMNVMSRVVALSLLSAANDNGCPAWLTEAYGIYAGGDLKKYGTPPQIRTTSFRDFQQEFFQVRKEKEMVYFYAKLSDVIKFLIDKYGEKKLDSLFLAFDGIQTFEQVFEGMFSEKCDKIEKSWREAIRNRKTKQ